MRLFQVFAIALVCAMPALAWAEDGSDTLIKAVPVIANEDQGVEPWLPPQNQDEAAGRVEAPALAAGKNENMGCHRQQRAQTVFYTQ